MGFKKFSEIFKNKSQIAYRPEGDSSIIYHEKRGSGFNSLQTHLVNSFLI